MKFHVQTGNLINSAVPLVFICFPGTDTFKVRNRISLSFKISPFRADKKKKRSGFQGLIGFVFGFSRTQIFFLSRFVLF